MGSWVQIDGIWYCFGMNSYLRCGWIEDNGKWYYFAPDTGMMVRGTSVGGYYLNSDGVWVH